MVGKGGAPGRGRLRSVSTVSKLRTHSAVTLVLIGRRAEVREQIARRSGP
jgi:hypothetical protein